MIKYYIIDSATDESKETTKEDFYTSLIYNLDEAVEFEEITTYDALCGLKFMMSQDKNINSREISANGFIYQIEVIKED